MNPTRQLISAHLIDGVPDPGAEIALRIDQVVTEEPTRALGLFQADRIDLGGIRACLAAAEAGGLDGASVHHDQSEPLLLQAGCGRFGAWYSPSARGATYQPVVQTSLAVAGATLLGSTPDVCAAGAHGMLAMSAGSFEVAAAMAGEPFFLRMPEIWGIRLSGALPEWSSGKDVVLTLLRRHGAGSASGSILEYSGPGVAALSIADRYVMAEIGRELGAIASVFPCDAQMLNFQDRHGRGARRVPREARTGSRYDFEDEVRLEQVDPIAVPRRSETCRFRTTEDQSRAVRCSAPSAVQGPCRSSSQPYRAFEVAAEHQCDTFPGSLSFEGGPAAQLALDELTAEKRLTAFLAAGAQLHRAGCDVCREAPTAAIRLSVFGSRTRPREPGARAALRDEGPTDSIDAETNRPSTTIVLVEPHREERAFLKRRLQKDASLRVASFAWAQTAFLYLLGRPHEIGIVLVNADDAQSLGWLETRLRLLSEGIAVVPYRSGADADDLIRSVSNAPDSSS